MFTKILITALAAAAFLFLLWLLRGYMLMPIRPGRRTELTLTLHVSGPDPALEDTVDALLWLRENGTLPAQLVLEDAGMDGETRAVAELLAAGRKNVTLTKKDST